MSRAYRREGFKGRIPSVNRWRRDSHRRIGTAGGLIEELAFFSYVDQECKRDDPEILSSTYLEKKMQHRYKAKTFTI